LGVVILSVCPSVCLSVRLSHACFVTNPKNLPATFFTPDERTILLVFCHPTGLVGDVPFHLQWAIDVTHPFPFKNRSRLQISACKVSTVRARKKVQLWRTGSRTRAFQRVIDEVRTLPLSLLKGGSKSELFFFWNKSQLQLNEVCNKFLSEKTSTSNFVVHSFPYLTVHRCWGNTNPSTSNVASKWRTPLKKRWIGVISACSSSAVRAS